ncbi:AraC-type DNA-binding protein [Filimonas lacunae]|uniref:AraC-type DNA-binding protein n=1 Tax=Filimonas lacunae TaxID=477680 RepID=A0A173MHH0_9BACT|nr:helix-turn-helix domain-containing protein [Filimonas lacunae]BAV06939.1 transcriptional regulator, AraC family [Filimonas lacunae]SIS97507.1 AraC-type DNA-binding protein [Filimonas lacunae]
MKTGMAIHHIEPGAPLQKWLTNRYTYHLVLINQGTLQYQCGQKQVTLHKNVAGIIKAMDVVSNIRENQASGFVLSFSYDFLELSIILSAVTVRHFHTLTLDINSVLVSDEDNSMLCSFAAKLSKELNSSYYDEDDMLRSLFQVFLFRICKAVQAQDPPQHTHHTHISNFYSLLDQHFLSYRLTKDYARLMTLTPNHLNMVVKLKTGHPSSYIIHQRVLAEAKRMLICEEMNMKEIASRLGFTDNSHFSRFFKNQSGSTFSHFKNNFKALEHYQ